jgi:4a-hydroxytetrahydrobiopterin dehydratase
MPDTLTATQFDRRGLADWRYLLGGIEATFTVGSFQEAAELAGRIATAAEKANHHPNIDLRPPATVHVLLTSHDAHGVTEADVELAATISDLAAGRGVTPAGPTALNRLEVCIDVMDMDAVRPFWQAVLGYEAGQAGRDGRINEVLDPRGIGPAFWFQQMDEPRPQRNRIHIDVTVPHDVADERIAAAVAAGGRVINDDEARAFWILADPEGNEACVCTWQDRD